MVSAHIPAFFYPTKPTTVDKMVMTSYKMTNAGLIVMTWYEKRTTGD